MIKKFEYITCKNTLSVGNRRLLLVVSAPFFVCFVIPWFLYWVIIHAAIWVYEGYVSEEKKPPLEGNNIFSIAKKKTKWRP